MCDCNLITAYTFNGHPFLVKMCITNGNLELVLTDKQSGEEWECNYDASYIESLTRKTGNFKQFSIFTTMIRSGLLKTSHCVTLDLFTYADLEAMSLRRTRSNLNRASHNNNRRYLIVTYSVEYDKINYPLPLEYCGFPDPVVLQDTIRRLELKLSKANEQLEMRNSSSEFQKINKLQNRVAALTSENKRLRDEVDFLSGALSKGAKSQVQTFHKAIAQIEKNLASERSSHHRLLDKLQNERAYLVNQVDKLRVSEKTLNSKLQQALSKHSSNTGILKRVSSTVTHEPIVNTLYVRKKPSCAKKNRNEVHQRSRTPSPQTVKKNTWTCYSDNSRFPQNQYKSRSRSSSCSSARQSAFGSRKTSPASSRTQSRRPSPQSSIKSYSSELPKYSKTTNISSPIYSRSTSPNIMQKVNNLFPNNRSIKKTKKKSQF